MKLQLFLTNGVVRNSEHIYARRAWAQLGKPCTAQQERSYWRGQLPSQTRKSSLRQIVRANENRPIDFGVTSNIFPPYLLLDVLTVRSEHLEFILTVSMEVIVQGFPTDGTPHPRVAILPIEKDNVALENKSFLVRRKCQVVPLKAPLHAVDDKGCERMDVHTGAGAVQGAQIRLAIPDANHRPRIAARSQHSIHQKARHAAVPIRVWVDITEKPMPQHCSHRRLGFSFQKVEERRHGVAHRLPPRRNVARPAQIHGYVPISGQCPRFDQASCDGGLEQFAIPVVVHSTHKRGGVLTGDHFLYSFFHELERLPVSPRREGVAISAITSVMLGVPTALPHSLNQGRRD